MRKTLTYMVSAIGLLSLSAAALGEEHVVAQKNKQFAPTSLDIKVGDVIKFANEDPFFHNVFSLSDIKSFDLGSYPAGQSRSVTFDKAGKVDVECAIHPQMKLTINVK